MLQITPQMKVLVALAPADFRKGIDGLVQLCKASLEQDPFAGTVFVFRNQRGTAIKVLVYDGQGFWLCHKRLSQGRFHWWPSAAEGVTRQLAAHQLAVLFSAGNPERTAAAPEWRAVTSRN
jgi:transposase